MFGRGFSLFRLLGFEVRADFSWLILAVFIVWTLAQGFFPAMFPELSVQAYWWMGVAGALGLFGSIIFHELSHSLVARYYGLPIKGITLFIFGGVAHMEEEPANAKTEFLMAIAGPIASFVLAGVFYALYTVAVPLQWTPPLVGVLFYLGLINLVLGAFNLVPAFPLDGGRVLRGLLWHLYGDLRRATRWAASAGTGFGYALIVLAVFAVMSGNFVGGIWWFLIGMFITQASRMSYQQLLMRQMLAGEPVRRFMNPHPITVPPSTTVSEFVENYVYRYHHKLFPVMDADEERPRGCVLTRQLHELPRERWDTVTVGHLMQRCGPENTITADTDAMKVLTAMTGTGSSRYLVTEDDRLVGMLTLKDLLAYFRLKLDLDERADRAAAGDHRDRAA